MDVRQRLFICFAANEALFLKTTFEDLTWMVTKMLAISAT